MPQAIKPSPTAVFASPVRSRRRSPKRVTRELTIIPVAPCGTQLTSMSKPAVRAEYPRVSSKYWVVMKYMPKRDAANRSRAISVKPRTRWCHRCSGRIGAEALRSQATAMTRTIAPIIPGRTLRSTRARVIRNMEPVSRTAPSKSNRPGREGKAGKNRTASTSTTTAMGTLIQNPNRQDKKVVINPPISIPPEDPRPAIVP